MESNLLKSEISDTEYVSGLSTVLVTTIDEARDRISEVQHIFCSQLFPKFQNLNKMYTDATEAAERTYKETEKYLLSQITRIESEKQQVTEENQLLKLEKAILRKMKRQLSNRLKDFKEVVEKKTTEINEGREVQLNMQKVLKLKVLQMNLMLQKKQKGLELETENCRGNLAKKTDEVVELMGLKKKLLCVNQSKASLIEQKDMQLKEYEDRTNGLKFRVEKMEKKVEELHSSLRQKMEELGKAKVVQENLLSKVEYQITEMMNKEELLKKCEKNNGLLAAKIDLLANRVNELQKIIEKKNYELQDRKHVQEQLQKQIDSYHTGKMNRGQEFDNYEKEKKQLLDKQRGLEEKVDMLQQNLHKRSKESYQGIELHGALLKQIEAKNSEVASEKNKRRKIVATYKSLKCQYDVLCRKYGHTAETIVNFDTKEDQSKTIRKNQSLESFCAAKATCLRLKLSKQRSSKNYCKKIKLHKCQNPVLQSHHLHQTFSWHGNSRPV